LLKENDSIKDTGKVSEEKKKEETQEKIKLTDTKHDNFSDTVLIRECVCILGSVGEDKSTSLLVRMEPKYEYMKRAIDTQLSKMHSDITLMYEPMGPHDDYIPLYDLVLRKRDNNKSVSELREEIDLRNITIEPMIPITPMKSSKEFYKVEDTIGYVFD